MSETTSRLSEVIVTLNRVIARVSDNDTTEFDIEERLSKIENQVETLDNEVEETIAFTEDMSS
jgi:peptidoglycan hydrolase CwlO-like protein